MSRRGRVLVVMLVLVALVSAVRAEAFDLTGVWRTQGGPTFYVRQLGHEIWWFGQQAPVNPRWTNVARGTVDGSLVHVNWVDVPMGGTRHQGSLTLRVVDPGHLAISENPDDFWSPDWYKQ